MKNRLLAVVATAEGLTGLVLFIYPPIAKLLFGAEIAGIAAVMSRFTGITLIALGVACWPGSAPLCGMLSYSGLATLYLGYIAIRGESVGILLWPAVVLHAVLTLLLARNCLSAREA